MKNMNKYLTIVLVTLVTLAIVERVEPLKKIITGA